MKSRIKGGTSFKGTSSNNRTMGVPENDFAQMIITILQKRMLIRIQMKVSG